MELVIRKAGVADIALIGQLADVCFRQTYRDILSAEQLEYMMDWMYSAESLRRQMTEEGHVYFLAELDGEAVGYVSVQPEGTAEDGLPLWHLQKIYVLPDCQAGGVGKRMFRHALDYVRLQTGGPCRVELNVNRNNPAVGFYEHLGMRRMRQGDFPIGQGYYMNDYIMGIEVD
jgi:ribosomal protein S18 acetylase RimI-like enzyme